MGWWNTHQPEELRAKQTAPSDSCASPVGSGKLLFGLDLGGSSMIRFSYREHIYDINGCLFGVHKKVLGDI